MLTKLEIKNYKSICDASITLSPFTLLIGANGTGKSNFVSVLKYIASPTVMIAVNDDGEEGQVSAEDEEDVYSNFVSFENMRSLYREYIQVFQKHTSHLEESQKLVIHNDSSSVEIENGEVRDIKAFSNISELRDIEVFQINPDCAGREEEVIANPLIKEDGSGVVQVLDSLKSGDREDLFQKVEEELKRYIPELEKLSFIPGKSSKRLQVREQYISSPLPLSELSEGTKLTLTILAILYQENPPSLVCIEDIDRGIHPRLFQQVIELCFDLSKQRGIQIVATTHNPYILDQFVGNESAVVIVEKKEGCTTFTTLAERLAQLQTNGSESEEEMPLGSLWYSGLVGGVPKR